MASLILISGEEEFLIERAAHDEAQGSLFTDVLEFRADDEGLSAYYDESRRPVFGSSRRAFIVRGCKEVPVMPEGDDDLLIACAKPGKTVLEHPGARRKLHFPKLKVWGDKNEVVGWILREGERLNIDLSRVAGALFVNSGIRLRKLASEIEKIASVAPPGSPVTPELAKSVLCFSAEVTPKDIIDALCAGRTNVAVAYYDRLQESGDETGWILAFLHRHVIQMLRLGRLIDAKLSDSDIAASLDLNAWVLGKFVRPLHGLWSRSSLHDSAILLASLDERHKTGRGSVDFDLEQEIIRLSEEAKNAVGRN